MSLKRINKGTFVVSDFEYLITSIFSDTTRWSALLLFRACRLGQGPTSKLLRRPSRWWYVPLASYHHGTRWLSICWRCLFLGYSFPSRLPFQAAQGSFHDSYLPLQHQLERRYLSWYSQGPVVSCIDNLQSSPFHLFPIDGPQPRWSSGSWYCPTLEDGQSSSRQYRPWVDFKVRNVTGDGFEK